jgi:superfamily II DNA or RNA helicase
MVTVSKKREEKLAKLVREFFAVHPDVKDGRYIIADLLVGEIQHECSAQALKPLVYGHQTGIKINKPMKHWITIIKNLFNHKKRNKIIVDQVIKDLKDGHTIVIPTVITGHAKELKRLIDKAYGSEVCFLFNGEISSKKRDEAKNIMNFSPKARVVLATRSMLTGLNVPRWSAIYTVAPISNKPLYLQEVLRVATPHENKKPIVRYFFDENINISQGCLRTCKQVLDTHHFKTHKSFNALQVKSKPTRVLCDDFVVSSLFKAKK